MGTRAEVDRAEVVRNLGGREADASPEAKALLDRGIRLVREASDCRACWMALPVAVGSDTADFGLFSLHSRDLCHALSGCGIAVIFAATIGIGTDNLIRRYGAVQPSLAAVLQAAGAAAVEDLCDRLCAEISVTLPLRRRYSPGYGDLPLQAQREIFGVLDCPKNAGITLTERLLMIPSKSVTAIAGVRDSGWDGFESPGCIACDTAGDCKFRRG
jgi:hypothetical protein